MPSYQVMPDLPEDEYAALKADIAAHGVLVAVEMDEDGNLLDGHHRVRAWQELCDEGQELPPYPVTVRYGLSEAEKRNHARRLNVMRRQLSKEALRQHMAEMRADGMSYRQIASTTGYTPEGVRQAVAGVNYLTPETVTGSDGKSYPAAHVRETAEAYFAPEAEEETREERAERRALALEDRRAALEVVPGGQYRVIYADPPWRYEHVETENRAIENHYPTLELSDICALPIGNMAADDAVLFMWATSPKLAEAMQVIEAWGFNYRTCMVWVKDVIGMGYYARQRHELLLIAVKGHPPVPATDTRPDSVQEWPRGRHSEKPHLFYELIERMYPSWARIELFARNQRAGWDAWGNEVAA